MEISSKAKKLLQENFRFNSSDLKALYSSFDSDGNVIIAYYNKLGELCISRGIGENVNPVGIVNRIPVRYNTKDKVIDGFYLYACVVDEQYRGKGIFKELINNAKSDANFLCVIPHKDEYFGLYKHLGFTECKESGFPVEIEKGKIFDNFSITDGDNKTKYHKILKKRSADGFTCGGLFLSYALNKYHIGIIDDKGYVIYKEKENDMISVFDFYYPDDDNSNIEEIKNMVSENKKIKSLQYGLDGEIESVNCFGEYLY